MNKNFKADEIIKMDKENLWHHMTQHKTYEKKDPMVVVEGNGLMIKDINGNEYLDVTSGGVWCVNVGYGRDSIADAVSEQLKAMPFYSSSTGSVPAINLADKIISLLPRLKKVYFQNSGSEANEKAFKMVRHYFRLKYKDDQTKNKFKILYRDRDYHGTTLGALSACGQGERKAQYGPFVDGFVEIPHCCCYRCPFGKTYPECNIKCARAIEDIIKKENPNTIGGIIIEPITAGGGIIPPVKEYYPILQEICKKYEVLMIMDEVVCGFGRTGKMFGHEHFEVDPDIVTLAKGLTSAYMPLSATVVKEYIYDMFLNDPSEKLAYFRDISTYGGCAGAMAASLENIRIMEDEKLCENSTAVGDYLLEKLQPLKELSIVGDIRSIGLFSGIELVENKESKEPASEDLLAKITGEIASHNILVGKANRSIPNGNNVIFFAPALSITKQQVDTIVDATYNAIKKYCI
jgi:taurine-pyruvate aminotransferase